MYGKFQDFLKTELQSIKDAGLYKSERIIVTPQDAEIKLATGETVLNFCANNYLGLSSNPTVIEGAKKALDSRGYGMSSVRFICGTQDIHKELEAKISQFFGNGRYHSLRCLFRCQRWCIRTAIRAGRCYHFRRIEPRFYH